MLQDIQTEKEMYYSKVFKKHLFILFKIYKPFKVDPIPINPKVQFAIRQNFFKSMSVNTASCSTKVRIDVQ